MEGPATSGPPRDEADVALNDLASRYGRLEAVYRLTRTIAAASGEDEICRIAIEALLEAAPGRRCSLLLFDHEGVARFRAWHGISDRYRAAVEGHCPWKAGDRGAEPIALNDVRDEASLASFEELFAAEAIRALVFIPLNGRGGVLGKFMIYGAEPGDPIAGDLPLARNIADLVAIVVERSRSEQLLLREHALFTSGPVVSIRWAPGEDWPLGHVSPNIRQFGYSAEDFLNGKLVFKSLVHPDDIERVRAEVQAYAAAGLDSFEQHYRIRDAAGNWRQLYDRTTIVRDRDGSVRSFDGYVLDITEQRKLEQELLQAQKMESVGRLAGGVAHDFNNLLTVILAAAEHAAAVAPPGGELAQAVDSIAHAAERAATLTSQLLSFARKQVIAPRVLDLNALLAETAGLLTRVIGEHIELGIACCAEPAIVRMDPGQLQQILVNLALNARDAMPEGGRLTFTTAHVEASPQHPDPMIELRVTDTGQGMSRETLEHLFEPFFTTKGIGKGTGLGLATCYGIVTQSHGSITATSEVGRGACFVIRLPRVSAECAEAGQAAIATRAPEGRLRATILLAEDEPLVREFASASLRRGGFEVLAAPDGSAALALAAQHPGSIDLLITDLVMPHMNGRELAEHMRLQRPGIRVLYSTGYDPEIALGLNRTADGSSVLMKPFTSSLLIERVRILLNDANPNAPRHDPTHVRARV